MLNGARAGTVVARSGKPPKLSGSCKGRTLGRLRYLPAIGLEHRIHIRMENVVRVVADGFDGDGKNDFQHLPLAGSGDEGTLEGLDGSAFRGSPP
jgi:hypothetical protein